MILFFISFLGGVLTVLAPCILPLLPVIVGGSISDGKPDKKKALTVITALGVSIILFTFVLKVSTLFISIPPDFWQYVSGGIVTLLGVITLFPELWEKIPLINKLNRESNKTMSSGFQKKSILGDIIIGASLGPVFSTCSPVYFLVLASVLPKSFSAGFLDLLAYVVGLGLSLFIIAVVGQRLVSKLGSASDPKGWFKRTLGILFLIVGIAIMFGADKVFEQKLLDAGIFDVTKIEQSLLIHSSKSDSPVTSDQIPENVQSSNTSGNVETSPSSDGVKSTTNASVSGGSKYLTIDQKKVKYKMVAEITNPSGYVNTGGQPINIAQYRGKKVVLVDFWTYSCINCQRTTPYLNTWYSKYEDKGLVIIGVHTPEFSFEKVQKNVEDATVREGIKYPVVLDNDYATWNAFGNQFWPRKYLVDIDGFVVYDKIGEGDYDITEREIQKALSELDSKLNMKTQVPSSISNPSGVVSLDNSKLGSPETYFGSSRNEFLSNGNKGVSGVQTFTLPTTLNPNSLYLVGTWNITAENADAQTSGDIEYHYKAKNVYFVGSGGSGTTVDIYQDGKLVSASAAVDVDSKTGKAVIKEERLYHLIQNADYEEHTLRIHVTNPGLKAFTFTFG